MPPIDHYGKVYPTISDMCAEYGITISAFDHRMSRHGDLRYALEGGLYQDPRDPDKRYDYLWQACREYNIPLGECRERLKSGWSLADALMTPSETNQPKRVLACVHISDDEHYETVRIACEKYGIRTETFRKRLSYGWTIEDALKKPVRCYLKRNEAGLRTLEFSNQSKKH